MGEWKRGENNKQEGTNGGQRVRGMVVAGTRSGSVFGRTLAPEVMVAVVVIV